MQYSIASSSLCNLQKSFCLDPKHTQNNRCLSIRKQAVGLDPYYLHSNNGSRIMGITWEITLARVSFYNYCCPIHTAGDYGMDIRRQNYVSAPASNHVQVIRPYVVPKFSFLHVFVTRTYVSRCTNPGSQTGFCHFVTRYQRQRINNSLWNSSKECHSQSKECLVLTLSTYLKLHSYRKDSSTDTRKINWVNESKTLERRVTNHMYLGFKNMSGNLSCACRCNNVFLFPFLVSRSGVLVCVHKNKMSFLIYYVTLPIFTCGDTRE